MQNAPEHFLKAAMSGSEAIRFIPRHDTEPLDIEALEGSSGPYKVIKYALLDENGIKRAFTPQQWKDFLGIDTEPTEEPLREESSEGEYPSPTGNPAKAMFALRSPVLAEKIYFRWDESDEDNTIELYWEELDGSRHIMKASEFIEYGR